MSSGVKDKIGGVDTSWKSNGLVVTTQDLVVINLQP
jgi:hypothetical protein